MGALNDQQDGVSSFGEASNQAITWIHGTVPGNKLGFSGLALDISTAAGAVTTIYFWPDTSGKLRYGTTVPTTATQNSAGTAIGS